MGNILTKQNFQNDAFSTMTEDEKANTRGLLSPEYLQGEPTDLPTENLSVSVDWRNEGAVNAIQYLERHDAMLEDDYPYTAKDGTCYYSAAQATRVHTTGYTNVRRRSESQLKAAVAQGVVSVAIEADKAVFQQYTSGIFDSSLCGTSLDHGVALVGYGSEAGQNYWILRNSWGTTWGEDGYMRLADNGDGSGICGVQLGAVYPATN